MSVAHCRRQSTLESWTTLQRKWIALEPIFTAPDITRQLPGETKAFRAVDLSWRDIMRRAREDSNALRACTRLGLLDTLNKHNAALDAIQRGLDEYLESKRAIFPRFYFISSEELLHVGAGVHGARCCCSRMAAKVRGMTHKCCQPDEPGR